MSVNQSDDEEEERGEPQTILEIVQTTLRQQSRLLVEQRNEVESSMSASRGITFRNRQEIDKKDYAVNGCLILSVIFFLSGAVLSRIPTSRQAYGGMYLIFSVFYSPHCFDQFDDHGQEDCWRFCIKILKLGAVAMYFGGALVLILENDVNVPFFGFSALWIFGAILSIIEYTFEMKEYIRMDDRPLLKLLEKSIGILTSILIIAASSSKIDAYTGYIGNFTVKYELGTDLFLAAAVFHALYSLLAVLDMFTV